MNEHSQANPIVCTEQSVQKQSYELEEKVENNIQRQKKRGNDKTHVMLNKYNKPKNTHRNVAIKSKRVNQLSRLDQLDQIDKIEHVDHINPTRNNKSRHNNQNEINNIVETQAHIERLLKQIAEKSGNATLQTDIKHDISSITTTDESTLMVDQSETAQSGTAKSSRSNQKKKRSRVTKANKNVPDKDYLKSKVDIDQLLELKTALDNLLIKSGTVKDVSSSANKELYTTFAPSTPAVYTQSKKHKQCNFDETTFGRIYADITKEHNTQIKITQTFVRNFLKGIIADIKQTSDEKWPRCMNLDTIVKSIADSLPKTMELDSFYSYVGEYLVAKSSQHYYYDVLASRIAIKRIHNITTPDFLTTAKLLQENLDKNNDRSPILSDDVFDVIVRHHARLQEAIKYERDYLFDYFGVKTLERSYLYKLHFTKFKTIERPQHMIMRVALGIHGEDIDSAIETYDLISEKYFTHATPTLFNSGTKRPQMSSCFLQAVGDSIESIFEAVSEIAFTSKWSGGIGVHLSALRSRGSLIRGTNGLSSGIIPLCVLLNKLAKYINQGGKRNGSIACFCKDTEVFTVNEGVKKIQDVKIGDLVVTHKNRVKPVVQIHKNPLKDRKIYKLEVERNKDIYVTGNHRFWSFYSKNIKTHKNDLGWNSVEKLKDLLENKETHKQACYISFPERTNIKDTHNYKIDVMDYKDIILKTDISGFEIDNDKIVSVTKARDINGYVKYGRSQPINMKWNITEDFANLIGMWLGDGHIRKAKKDGKVLGIGFTVHTINQKEINYIKKICVESFGCSVTQYTPKNRNITQIYVNSCIVGIVFMELFGNYFNDKKIPNMIFNWPETLINNLMAGLITTDGSITKTKCNVTLGLSNEKLMTQLYHLCRNNGICASFVNSGRGTGHTCDHYTMSIPINKEIMERTCKYYADDRVARCLNKAKDKKVDTFLKIINITETDRNDEFVYTLGVKDDHSYTVEGLIAENCYLEPHHADIYDFIDLRKNTGNDDNRARDLYLALWVSSLFMQRVREDAMWSLMCPDECPGLNQVYGDEYVKLYEKYESEGRYIKQVKARDLWLHILVAQSETGFPYILYKDNANAKSNQKNLGTIRSSNLCAEIIQYSDENETAVCFTADTEIMTKDGIRKIVDCDGKEVLSYFNNDVDLTHDEHYETAKLINNGTKLVYELKTDGNRPLKVTADHPILIKEDDAYVWKKVSELREGDKVCTPMLTPLAEFVSGVNKVSDKDCLLDGCNLDLEIKPGTLNRSKIIENRINDVKMMKPAQITSWLTGLFATNSSIIKIKGDQTEIILSADLSDDSLNKNILYSIQSLLLPFGIRSKVNDDNILTIRGKTNLSRFSKFIDFRDISDKEKEYIEDCSRILSITQLGHEQVYDLSLGESHNYVANGHIVHNCNLASLCLPMYIEVDTNGNKFFNYEKLIKVCRVAVRNLDKIIDRNYYPTEKTKRSNLRHRPMGIGVQGLADVYNIMGYGFDSPDAYDLNNRIFETIYYACIDESKELAKRFGAYSSFKGSPASKGQLQFHMWGISEDKLLMGYDWKTLVIEIMQYGLRNSLLTALMPTASTSQIMGNAECIEPYMSNIFKRSTLAGEFIVVNKNLMRDLLKLNLWDDDMRKRLIIENGSVQNIGSIPDNLKRIYKTAFEIKQMHIVRQSIARGKFVDQSQSLNLFMATPDFDILTSALFDAHDGGNKTGMYYYRSLPAINPINFGIDVEDIKRLTGRDATLDVLTGGYNISRDAKKNVKETSESGDGFCKRIPGAKIDECNVCGS